MLLSLPLHLQHHVLQQILLKHTTGVRASSRHGLTMSPIPVSIYPYIRTWSIGVEQQRQRIEDGRKHCRWMAVDAIVFKVVRGMWSKIFIADNIQAADIMALQAKSIGTACSTCSTTPTMCELTSMRSSAMLAVVVQRWSLEKMLGIAGALLVHAVFHHRGATIMSLLQLLSTERGGIQSTIARQILHDSTLMNHVWNNIRYPTVLNEVRAAVIGELTQMRDAEHAQDIMDKTGEPVFHLLVRSCNASNEDATIAALRRCFMDCPLHIRNAHSIPFGDTVLQELYRKRPLNRNIASLMNAWPRNSILFLN
jgi:hypothetical protein